MTDIAGTVPVIAVDKVQAVALAVCTYYFGVWLKGKVGVLSRYSIPSPVVGGMSFAIVVSFLEYFNIVKVQAAGLRRESSLGSGGCTIRRTGRR